MLLAVRAAAAVEILTSGTLFCATAKNSVRGSRAGMKLALRLEACGQLRCKHEWRECKVELSFAARSRTGRKSPFVDARSPAE